MRPPSAHTARVRHSGRRPPRQSRRASVVGFFRLFSPVPRESRSLAIVAAACLHLPHVSMGDLSPFGALFGALALRLRAPASGAGVGRWLLGHPLRGRLHFLARYGVFKVQPPGFGVALAVLTGCIMGLSGRLRNRAACRHCSGAGLYIRARRGFGVFPVQSAFSEVFHFRLFSP